MSIDRSMIINALQERGYDAREANVVKNSVPKQGITIHEKGSNMAPCIYVESYIECGYNLEKAVEEIISIYEENKKPSLDVNMLLNRDYIESHVLIGLQRASGDTSDSDSIIKRECELKGTEQYLYLVVNDMVDDTMADSQAKIKVNPSILKAAGVSEEKAWVAAERNTFAEGEADIVDIVAILEKLGYDTSALERVSTIKMYVVTNKTGIDGAIQILNKKAINEWLETLEEKPSKIIALPSSIHECLIVIPETDDIDVDYYSDMVACVNGEEVAPEEQLSDEVTIIKF